jgi:hypothetical protein
MSIVPIASTSNRIRFTVNQVPFGATTVVPEGPDVCSNCKELFVGTICTQYGARKPLRHEIAKYSRAQGGHLNE